MSKSSQTQCKSSPISCEVLFPSIKGLVYNWLLVVNIYKTIGSLFPKDHFLNKIFTQPSTIFTTAHPLFVLSEYMCSMKCLAISKFLQECSQNFCCKPEAATGDFLCEKMFLKVSQNSQENICRSLFFNKTTRLRSTTLFKTQNFFMFKTRLGNKYFFLSFEKFLRTPFYRIPSGDFFGENSLQYEKKISNND